MSCFPQVPVAQGPIAPMNGIEKARIADFVHGTDGFGNTSQTAPLVCRRVMLYAFDYQNLCPRRYFIQCPGSCIYILCVQKWVARYSLPAVIFALAFFCVMVSPSYSRVMCVSHRVFNPRSGHKLNTHVPCRGCQ